jgi:D-threo-aldose 1-dehydrogenase
MSKLSRLDFGPIGLGTAPLGNLYAALDETTALQTVQAAIDGGVRLFDTAPLYGHGLAEHRLGTVLRQVPRERLIVSTKVGRVLEPSAEGGDRSGYFGGLPHRARFDYSYDGAWRSLEQSLLRLGLARIDLLLIHDVDAWTHGADGVDARFGECMDGSYRALHEMRAQGLVRAIGVGVNESAMCERFARVGDFDLMMLAGRYSLLEQGALDDFLPTALARGIGVLIAGVFNSGVLAQPLDAPAKYNYGAAPPPVVRRVRRLRAVCAAHGVSLVDAAVQFPRAHPAVCAAVLGAVSPAEVQQNLRAVQSTVPNALWAELKADGLIRPDAPVPEAK